MYVYRFGYCYAASCAYGHYFLHAVYLRRGERFGFGKCIGRYAYLYLLVESYRWERGYGNGSYGGSLYLSYHRLKRVYAYYVGNRSQRWFSYGDHCCFGFGIVLWRQRRMGGLFYYRRHNTLHLLMEQC